MSAADLRFLCVLLSAAGLLAAIGCIDHPPLAVVALILVVFAAVCDVAAAHRRIAP